MGRTAVPRRTWLHRLLEALIWLMAFVLVEGWAVCLAAWIPSGACGLAILPPLFLGAAGLPLLGASVGTFVDRAAEGLGAVVVVLALVLCAMALN
jgi:hypothetical protein